MSKFATASILVALAGCVAGAAPGAMTTPLTPATLVADSSRLRQAVGVGTVSGGKETSPLWKSNVSDADFKEALRRSLAAHGLLAAGDAPFRIDAELLELRQPAIGLDMTVTANVRYRVLSATGRSTLFETEIRSPFTAAFSSSFLGAERLKLANEGAARENLRLFLEALVAAERASPNQFDPAIAMRLRTLSRDG